MRPLNFIDSLIQRRILPVALFSLIVIMASTTAQASSETWQTNAQIFETIKQSGRTRAGEEKALQLLHGESLAILSGQSIEETRSEYFVDLISYIAANSLTDPTPILLEPDVIKSGGIAIAGIVRQGDRAVNSLLSAYQNHFEDDVYRVVSTKAMEQMILEKTLSSNPKGKILKALRSALNDPNPYVRMNATSALIAADQQNAEP